jgi:RNA polymerase sigma-70 factor, ECF subfamily
VNEPSHDILLERARRGDRAAFDQLVRLYWPRIFALALQISGHREDAEDIAQETFLRAHRGLRAFEGRSSFQTWLYRIALNRALSHRSGKTRRPTHVSVEDDRVRAALQVDAPDPAAARELAEDYALLLAAMDRLSPALKAAVVLVALQQLSHAEAGAITGATPGTIAWRMHEARRQLQSALSPVSEVRRKGAPRAKAAKARPGPTAR